MYFSLKRLKSSIVPLQSRGGVPTPVAILLASSELQMLEPDAQWDSELRVGWQRWTETL